MRASSADGPPNEIDPVGPWQPGSVEPPPLDAALHVWRARLTAVDDRVLTALSDDERERASRIVGESARELWMRSRGVLRELLGRYLHADPRTIVLGVGPHGKPALTGSPARDRPGARGRAGVAVGLTFNLSHSGELALYAFASERSVGIDVELVRPPSAEGARKTDHVALARRTFGATRAERLAELEPPLREREFLRWWTVYEAELKRRGTGISGLPDDEASCWVAELDVGPHGAAAVASEPAPRELLRFEWT